MKTEWRINPHTDAIQYLGGWLTSPNYRGCIVQENSGPHAGEWAVCPRDWQTEDEHRVRYVRGLEAAREALENVTPGGHKCEIFENEWLGHCPERASLVTVLDGEQGPERGVLLCRVHARRAFTDDPRLLVEEWESVHGPITHETGPIEGERIRPPMAAVKRQYLIDPTVWGDEWSGYELRMVLAQDVVPGTLVVFDYGNAWAVTSVDVCPIPHSEDLWRFNCAGATYGTYFDTAVPVLDVEWPREA